MQQAQVTIVVVPRDHFSDTRESLESIYCHTRIPFELIYVDGGSPPRTQRYLQEKSAKKQFTLIRTDHYLSPNRARNIGLQQVRTPFLVFIDNDVIVAPGWLEKMMECATDTGATLVSPLNCERKPVHERVHFAGGEVRVEERQVDGRIVRQIIDKIFLQGRPVEKVYDRLTRKPTGSIEFHCVLVRTAIFEKIGLLDEGLLSTRENLDFCLMVAQAGGTTWFEPHAVITYLPPLQLVREDVPFFVLRWSDEWDLASFHRLRDKWRLAEDDYFQRQYRNLGWRRKEIYVKRRLLRWAPSWKLRIALTPVLFPLERIVNRHISRRYFRQHGRDLQKSGGVTGSSAGANFA